MSSCFDILLQKLFVSEDIIDQWDLSVHFSSKAEQRTEQPSPQCTALWWSLHHHKTLRGSFVIILQFPGFPGWTIIINRPLRNYSIPAEPSVKFLIRTEAVTGFSVWYKLTKTNTRNYKWKLWLVGPCISIPGKSIWYLLQWLLNWRKYSDLI